MKILGSDYDGTLYCGGVSEENRASVAKWQSLGNKFGIVSGRGVDFPPKIKKQYPDLKIDFFVLCNGAYITDGAGRRLFATSSRGVDTLTLLKDLFSFGCVFVMIHSAHGFQCVVADLRERPEWIAPENTCLIGDFSGIESFYQLSVRFPASDVATEKRVNVCERYGEWLNPLQNGVFLDIVPLGVNKATGMSAVMHHYGGREEDVIVIGDNRNDMDMIRAFRSFAMESGIDALKAEATGVVRDVAELIQNEIE